MSEEIQKILKENESKKFDTYTEFRLVKPVNMKDDNSQKLVYDLNNKQQTYATYNSRSYYCDTIGICDNVNGERWIDFDDDMWTMTNKGINVATSKTTYNK